MPTEPTSLNRAADRRPKVAILDDYAALALALADWSLVQNSLNMSF